MVVKQDEMLLNVNTDIIGYSLVDFINTFPEIAHVKDSQTFRYQYTNQKNLDVYGLNRNEFVGKTIFELSEGMKDRWPKGFAETIHQQDEQIISTGKPSMSEDEIFLNKHGDVAIHSIMKTPLFNQKKAVVGILTLSFDSTMSGGIERLRDLYHELYSSKSIANKKFMEYINFQEGINGGLTERELDCLIAISKHRTLKQAAAHLGVSYKTVETHIQHVKQKLNCYNLPELIEKMISVTNL